MKSLVLAEELQMPHIFSVVDTTDDWYSKIHLERYVPALRDQDLETGQSYTSSSLRLACSI